MSVVSDLDISMDFSKKIQVNSEKLGSLTDCIVQLHEDKPGFEWVDDNYWLSKSESSSNISQFFTLGNSINFKYWSKTDSGILYCNGVKGGLECRGAKYMWRCLKVCYDKGIFDISDSEKLSKISFEEFRKIFQDDDGKDVLPSLKQRHDNWIDFATKLNQYWNGSMMNVLNACNNSLVNFSEELKKFIAFDDPISKMIMVNALMHQGRGIIKFREQLIPGIDYQILKQLLRQGIIIPDQDIQTKINHYEILNNSEALDLRRSGLFALSQVMKKSNISGDYIDNMIWGNRTNCEEQDPVCMIPGKEKQCPFHKFCEKKVDLLIPLEDTRYY